MQLAAKQCAPSPAPQRPGLVYLGHGSFSRSVSRKAGQIGLQIGQHYECSSSCLAGRQAPFHCLIESGSRTARQPHGFGDGNCKGCLHDGIPTCPNVLVGTSWHTSYQAAL